MTGATVFLLLVSFTIIACEGTRPLRQKSSILPNQRNFASRRYTGSEVRRQGREIKLVDVLLNFFKPKPKFDRRRQIRPQKLVRGSTHRNVPKRKTVYRGQQLSRPQFSKEKKVKFRKPLQKPLGSRRPSPQATFHQNLIDDSPVQVKYFVPSVESTGHDAFSPAEPVDTVDAQTPTEANPIVDPPVSISVVNEEPPFSLAAEDFKVEQIHQFVPPEPHDIILLTDLGSGSSAAGQVDDGEIFHYSADHTLPPVENVDNYIVPEIVETDEPDIDDKKITLSTLEYQQLFKPEVFPGTTARTPVSTKSTPAFKESKPVPQLQEKSISEEEFSNSINSVIAYDEYVSEGYEHILDQRISEIQKQAELLEQRYWGGKSDFRF